MGEKVREIIIEALDADGAGRKRQRADQILSALSAAGYELDRFPVRVTASDYAYDGWQVIAFPKRKSGEVRCVVEDENGRLFIHNKKQVERRTGA